VVDRCWFSVAASKATPAVDLEEIPNQTLRSYVAMKPVGKNEPHFWRVLDVEPISVWLPNFPQKCWDDSTYSYYKKKKTRRMDLLELST
jgi:hypothetical protein